MMKASLDIPAFMKGRDQLDPLEVEHTRHLANNRIHVERVIGDLRLKYSILSDIIPMWLMVKKIAGCDTTPVDMIATVCCALVNLCPPIVN